MTLHGLSFGLRGKPGVCANIHVKNHTSVSDALLHLPHGPAVPACAPHTAHTIMASPRTVLGCAPHTAHTTMAGSRTPPGCAGPLNLPASGEPFLRAGGKSGSSVVVSHKAGVTLARCGLCVSEYRPGKRDGKAKQRQLENELKTGEEEERPALYHLRGTNFY